MYKTDVYIVMCVDKNLDKFYLYMDYMLYIGLDI